MLKVVIVTGSRRWRDRRLISDRLLLHVSGGENVLLIHGDAEGADRLAGRVGKAYGMMVTPMPADWDRLGDEAGPVRNDWMLQVGLLYQRAGAELFVEAFPLPNSVGTWQMIDICRKAGVEPHITEIGDAEED